MPTAPTSLTSTGGAGFANLSWNASSDNVGVVSYNVHRSTTSGFTPTTANRVAQPTGTTHVDTTLLAGTYYYKVTAQDAAGNVSAASPQSVAVVTSDTTPPSVSLTAPANGAIVSQSVTVSANAADNTAVAGVQFRLDGTNYGAEDTVAPYSVAWDTTAATNGPHTLTAVARDGANNSTLSAAVNVTVANSGGSSGLVAAYGFEEGVGTTTADSNGGAHNATLSGATWTTQGKFGKALSFNGSSNFVSAPDSGALDLTTEMTLEAWVRPASLSSWGTVLFKEQPGYYAYALYGNTGTNRPSGNAMVGAFDADTRGTAQLPLNTWSHLAVTYDGNMLILYVDGLQVSQLLAPGSIVTSTGLLKIGGNAIWGEWFNGLIDEVRVYDRTLTLAQIQADMTRPVVSADTTPPTAPTALTASGGPTSAQLGWAAASDDTAWCATTCTAARAPGSRRRWRTGSRSRRGRRTRTRLRQAPTTTGSPPRMRLGMWGRFRMRRRRRSVIRSRPRRRGCSRRRGRSGGRPCRGVPPRTTSASFATTSIAARPPASRPRRRTGSRNRAGSPTSM